MAADALPFKIEKNKARQGFPQLSLWIGKPKIGKSTVMAQLDKALIVTTDLKGYDEIDTQALVKVSALDEVYRVLKFFFSNENKEYDKLVIDEMRGLTEMFAKRIKQKENVDYVIDLNYGKGTNYMKDDVYMFLDSLKNRLATNPNKHIFLVAHADDRNSEIRLDINGKHEIMFLSMVDTIGLIDRNSDNETTVNFQARSGVEFGSRNKDLAKYRGELDWKKLFEIARGTNSDANKD